MNKEEIKENEIENVNGGYTPKPEPVIGVVTKCVSPEEQLGGKIIVVPDDQHINPFIKK